jgi:hypothetical protein
MKNINFFLSRFKTVCLFLFITAGFFTLLVPLGCHEEEASPKNDLSTSALAEREDERYELLGVSCFPDSLIEVCDSFPTLDTMLITLADYPGCTFSVVYEYYECRRGSNQYYYLGNYYLLSHNCPAFTAAYNAALAAGGATLAAFVENFDHDVFLAIKTNLANILIPVDTYPCDEGYAFFYNYIRTSCFKWCYIQNGSTVSSKQVACGSDCCVERTRACRDENGILILQTAYQTSYPPHCDGPTIYSTGLPGLCTSESACEFTCPN